MALARQRSSGSDAATAVAEQWQRDGGDSVATAEAAVSKVAAGSVAAVRYHAVEVVS